MEYFQKEIITGEFMVEDILGRMSENDKKEYYRLKGETSYNERLSYIYKIKLNS